MKIDWFCFVYPRDFTDRVLAGDKNGKDSLSTLYLKKSPNLVKTDGKTYVLYYPIKDYHIIILLEIQYILPHLVTSQ